MIKAFINKAVAVCVTSATVFSFAVAPVSAATYGDNLLSNPGFESGALGAWEKSGSGNLEISNAEAKTGTYSALTSSRSGNADGPKQTVDLEADTDYLVSVWIKPVSESAKARGKLRFTGDSSLGLSMIDCPAGQWTQFTATINSGNLTGVNDVAVWFQTSTYDTLSNDAFYLDDFEIRKVLPEVADSNLLASCDPGFENGAIDTSLWNTGTVTRTDTKAHTGTYSALSSGRSNNYDGPQVKSVALEASSKYYGSAWVYTDATSEKAKIRLQGTGVTNPSLIPLTAGEWNHISAVLSTTDAVSAKFYVQTNGTSDIYVDDCAVYKIGTSSVTVTSPLNGSPSAAIDSDLTLTFSDTVLNLDKGNVLINGSAVTGSIQTADNKNFTVDLGTLINSTEYTVKITGVLDTSYNMISDTTITFTTVAAASTPEPEPEPETPAENLIESNNPGFESGALSPWSAVGTVTVSNAQKYTGTYSALVSDRGANNHGPQITVAVEANKDYYISAWVKPVSGAGRGTVRMWANGGSTIAQPTMVDFAENTWTHTSAIVNSGTNTSVKIGVNTNNTTGGNVALYMDDFEIVPYTPTAVVSHTPSSEGKASVRATVSFTFSNKIDKATKENFTVTGRAVQSVVISEDKKTVTLTLDKMLDANTAYTVTATGLTDEFGVIPATAAFTFTTGESMAVAEAPAFYSGDTPIAELTTGEITVKAKFRNDGTAEADRPVMLAVMYGADGRLKGVKSTPLTGKLAIGEETTDLPLTLNVTSDIKSIAVYVLKSYEDITYLTSPVRLQAAE